MSFLLKADALGVRSGRIHLLDAVSFSLNAGESMAITGPSGSGKTTLGRILAGLQTPDSGTLSVRPDLRRIMIQQQDHFFAMTGQRSTYYSQRYENQGMDHCPTVSEYLRKQSSEDPTELFQTLEIESFADRKLLQLSNGERKRTQLAEALLQKPDLLVLDQPFTGLDKPSRAALSALLRRQRDQGISIIFICDPESVPPGIQNIVELKTHREELRPEQIDEEALFELLPAPNKSFRDIVAMRNVCVELNGMPILHGINWRIKPGEQWVLQGHNGAGKTTLLSLITADNPQGYTNDLILFDRKRGSGESIWEIKQKIGFVSPELHLYFLRGSGIFNTIPGLSSAREIYDSLSCLDVITSGFRDEIGFSSPPDDHQMHVASTWLALLQLNHLKDRLFIHASLGEQRVLLLARALVKSPSLLILDEPCQGLDVEQIRRFTRLLDRLCTRLQTTMIYVTHRDEEIPACVRHRLLLEKGRVVSNPQA
jgi:molybdate transport system ATP-binding protein